MTIYNPGIPTGLVFLSQDYKNIQNNFNQANTSFGSDHVPFAVNPTAPGQTGYHTNIHQIPQSDPTAIAGINQLYAKTVSGDTQLFSMSGLGIISQMTGVKRNARGWQYIGGVLMQWGVVTSPTINANTTLSFSSSSGINFNTSVYSVQLQLVGATASSNNSLFVVSSTVSNTGFTWRLNAGSGDFSSFYWLAIGV